MKRKIYDAWNKRNFYGELNSELNSETVRAN